MATKQLECVCLGDTHPLSTSPPHSSVAVQGRGESSPAALFIVKIIPRRESKWQFLWRDGGSGPRAFVSTANSRIWWGSRGEIPQRKVGFGCSLQGKQRRGWSCMSHTVDSEHWGEEDAFRQKEADFHFKMTETRLKNENKKKTFEETTADVGSRQVIHMACPALICMTLLCKS